MNIVCHYETEISNIFSIKNAQIYVDIIFGTGVHLRVFLKHVLYVYDNIFRFIKDL